MSVNLGDLAAREVASADTALAPNSGPAERSTLHWPKHSVTDYDDM